MRTLKNLTAWLIALPLVLPAQPGYPDLSFGQEGQLAICTGDSPCFADDVLLLPDGRFLVAGSAWNGMDTDFAVWRFAADGSLDTGFGTGGVAALDIMGGEDRGQALALRPGGGIVVAGYGRMGSLDGFALAAFDAEGSPDESFGDQGVLRIPFGSGAARLYDVAIRPDGKIVAAGVARVGAHNAFVLVQALPHGSPDPDFGVNGLATTGFGANATAFALALQPDGKILLAGQARVGSSDDFALTRYLPDGSLDPDFGEDGVVRTDIAGGNDIAYALALQPDGRILAGGTARVGTHNRFAAVRYLQDGSPDSDFGEDGIVTAEVGLINDIAHDLVVQEDGKILLAGRSPFDGTWHYSLVRLHPDGSPDSDFGQNGIVLTSIGGGDAYGHAIALQPDQRLLMAGSAWIEGLWYVGLTRYHLSAMTGSRPATGALPLRVFPNPTSGLLYLEEMQDYTRVEILDMRGQLVRLVHADRGVVDLSDLPSGTYLLRVHGETVRTAVTIRQ